MSNKILCSNQEIQADPELRKIFDVPPLGLLDPSHPAINESLKKKILHDRYHDKLIADGLETGHFRYDQNHNIQFRTGLPVYSFAGYIFEAYAVQVFNDYMDSIGRRAFIWSTRRKKANQNYVSQYKAIGTGFITTQSSYPQFYNPQHQLDIKFIRKNPKENIYEPAIQLGTTLEAGIQIKAITNNEKEEIIDPILSGKYSYVLTFLRHSDGMHSFDKCMNLIKILFKNGSIGQDQKNLLESSIQNPEGIGMDQRNIDEYYEYIIHWYKGRADIHQFISEGISLEVKGYKYSNGLLIPEDV